MPIIHHDLSIIPKDSEVLRRYIPYQRLKDLLENKELYFTRVDRFSDPFEGAIPQKEYEHRPEASRESSRFYENYGYAPITEEQALKEAAEMSAWAKEMRTHYCVNCWNIYHPGKYADAMWRLYLATNEGVAIQSSVKRLKDAFEDAPEDIIMSKVRYLDYRDSILYHATEFPFRNANLFAPLIHKRTDFSHETELRLLYEDDKKPLSHLVKIDVLKLIDKILLPPTCFDEFAEELEIYVKSKGYDFVIEKAQLSENVYF